MRLTRVLPTLFEDGLVAFPRSNVMKNIQQASNSLSDLEGRGSLLLVNKAQGPENQVAYLHRVLILPGEGINSSLLDALLALRQALVPGRSLATGSLGLRFMTQGSKYRTFQQP